MRRFWTLLLTPVLAVAFFMVASPTANAFGSEVLGCAWPNSGWVANDCGGGYGIVTYSAHNLAGTYSYNWTLTNNLGNTISNACNGVTWPCIYSGCTTTSSSCELDTSYGFHDHVYTAILKLTQSGQSRSITAQATGLADPPCRTC
jgi:hypothetical protein